MSIAKPIGFWLSSRYENGIEESRKPSVIAPVSLMFFNVPVSSSACAPPAQSVAASARPQIRKCFMCPLLVLNDFPECWHKPGRNRMYHFDAYGLPTASPVARRQTLFSRPPPGQL